MKEIVTVALENEMDIILAHKRAMKLAELSGCSLVSQTSFATAVSEVSRCAVEFGTHAQLRFLIETAGGKKYIRAEIGDESNFISKSTEAINYAKRLAGDITTAKKGKEHLIILKYQLNFSGTLSETKIKWIKEYFDKEPPLSAYDELRRKNQQLQDMADKIRETENEYKVVSDALPLMMFSATNQGQITFANRWLQQYLGHIPKDLSGASWQTIVHPQDVSLFSKEMMAMLGKQTGFSSQYRIKEKSKGEYLWHLLSITPLKNEKDIVTGWIGFLVDIHLQKVFEATLKDNKELKETQRQLYHHQEELERKVVELNRSNYELEQFAHLASHDLQEPLRKLFFYSDILRKKYSSVIDASGQTILNNMAHAAERMRELIQDLLSYSQLHQQKLIMENVNLNDVIHGIQKDLEFNIKEKEAIIKVDLLPSIKGNTLRLRQLFTNLISNSLKYSRADVAPVIEIWSEERENDAIIKVKDNGIGFDQQYSEKIFGLFERLHSRHEFPGTGIGLSICKKIAELHGGSISATSKENEFSIFEVCLPLKEQILVS